MTVLDHLFSNLMAIQVLRIMYFGKILAEVSETH